MFVLKRVKLHEFATLVQIKKLAGRNGLPGASALQNVAPVLELDSARVSNSATKIVKAPSLIQNSVIQSLVDAQKIRLVSVLRTRHLLAGRF